MLKPAPARDQVIVTRPEPDAAAFAKDLKALGLTPVLAPAMDIEWFTPQNAPQSAETQDLRTNGEHSAQDFPFPYHLGGIAFTSANGVRAFESAFLKEPPAAMAKTSDWRSLNIFCVGPATAAASEKAGFHKIQIAQGEVTSLTRLIIDAAPTKPILHIAGSDRAGDLITGLKTAGIKAQRLVLYKARANDTLSASAVQAMRRAQEIAQQIPQENHKARLWVALFSPRTADIFLKQTQAAGLNPALSHIHAACLSPAVAARLKGASFNSIKVAKTPITKDLIDIIIRQAPLA